MKHLFTLTGLLLSVAGCGTETPAGSTPPIAAVAKNKTTFARSSPEFSLSDAATNRIREVMAPLPKGTYLVVSVDLDDEKYCTGFSYNLQFEASPSPSQFEFLELNGIKLAIEKKKTKFLNGTTLDYIKRSAGIEGFVFNNPNENTSLPDELREKP